MTFATEKEKPQSWKIALVEIDLPQDSELFGNYSAGVWFRQMSRLVARTSNFSLFGTYASDNPDNVIYQIESIRVGNVPYQKVDSLTDLDVTAKAFYYDVSTRAES
jgi:hypothetical protein